MGVRKNFKCYYCKKHKSSFWCVKCGIPLCIQTPGSELRQFESPASLEYLQGIPLNCFDKIHNDLGIEMVRNAEKFRESMKAVDAANTVRRKLIYTEPSSAPKQKRSKKNTESDDDEESEDHEEYQEDSEE
jgi:hypothetical protein